MKLIRIVTAITLSVLLLSMILSVSLVSALEQNEASVTTFMSEVPKAPGQATSIRILFNSNTNKDLDIYYVGIHVDWMDTDQLFGIDYSSYPETVAGMENYRVDIINFTVPTSASIGPHTYYIGVDGYDEDGNAFSWKSNDLTLMVGNPESSIQPTSTPTANQNQPMDLTFVLYGVLVAVAVAIVALAIIVMKKRGTNSAAKSNANQPESPKPEQKPDDGQDFSI